MIFFAHKAKIDIKEFDDSRDAEDACYELNGRDLCGERVIVEMSRRAPRSGPRFGGGSSGGYGGPPRTLVLIQLGK